MCTLVDWEILAAVESHRLTISPWNPANLLQGHSLDVLLLDQLRDPVSKKFMTWSHGYFDKDHNEDDEGEWKAFYDMAPGEFLLGSTVERFVIPPDMLAGLSGKSGLGRQGLLVHVTAGVIDGGFNGQITLELKNVSHMPFRLVAGMRIGQMLFENTAMPARSYGHPDLHSHYQGQDGPTLARK